MQTAVQFDVVIPNSSRLNRFFERRRMCFHFGISKHSESPKHCRSASFLATWRAASLSPRGYSLTENQGTGCAMSYTSAMTALALVFENGKVVSESALVNTGFDGQARDLDVAGFNRPAMLV